MANKKLWLPWNYDTLVWDSNDYIWSEVFIMVQIGESFGGSAGGSLLLPNKNTWQDVEKQLDDKKFTEDDKKLFLQVIARVNGLVSSEVKTIDSSLKKSITVDHIRKTFNAFGQKVEVKVKNVKKQ